MKPLSIFIKPSIKGGSLGEKLLMAHRIFHIYVIYQNQTYYLVIFLNGAFHRLITQHLLCTL
jgi:hypothetical protein